MPPESKKFLWDMRHAARQISDFVRGQTKKDYDADLMLRSAVERQFEIPGEALPQLRNLDEPTAARITDSKRVGFRNQLIHGSAVMDNAITWRTIHEHLPILLGELDLLLPEPETPLEPLP